MGKNTGKNKTKKYFPKHQHDSVLKPHMDSHYASATKCTTMSHCQCQSTAHTGRAHTKRKPPSHRSPCPRDGPAFFGGNKREREKKKKIERQGRHWSKHFREVTEGAGVIPGPPPSSPSPIGCCIVKTTNKYVSGEGSTNQSIPFEIYFSRYCHCSW